MKKIKSITRALSNSFLFPLIHSVNKLQEKVHKIELRTRIVTAIARGAAAAAARQIEPTDPTTWEFSGFSQNGEDGIIDYLVSRLKNKTRYFIEIGSGDGIENNTAYLAHVKKFSGLMIDGNKKHVADSTQISTLGVETHLIFLDKNNIADIKQLAINITPDVFSLDIDGNDYYLTKLILESGFTPSIIVVEYNSAFGPDNAITVNYTPDFDIARMHPTALYYGVSISGWKKFFSQMEYRFVAVDSNGINAIFIKPDRFDPEFVIGIKGQDFVENFYQMKKFKCNWEKQFEMIRNLNFFQI